MDKYPLADVTYKVIGAAMEVHTELGPGFLEPVYHEALGIEMGRRDILFDDQPQIEISYKDVALQKRYIPDFLVVGEVVVEIKALSRLSSIEEAQIINYLKAAKRRVGLLVNFGASSLEFKRFVYENGEVEEPKQKNLRQSAKSVDKRETGNDPWFE